MLSVLSGTSGNDVVLLQVLLQKSPDFGLFETSVSLAVVDLVFHEGATTEESDTTVGLAAINAGVVATHLRHGLLHEKGPLGILGAGARSEGSALVHGDPIIDGDGDGNAQVPEVEAVSALGVGLLVDNDLLHAIRVLSDAHSGGKEPAVTEATLRDIVGADALGANDRSLAIRCDASPSDLVELSSLEPLVTVCLN